LAGAGNRGIYCVEPIVAVRREALACVTGTKIGLLLRVWARVGDR